MPTAGVTARGRWRGTFRRLARSWDVVNTRAGGLRGMDGRHGPVRRGAADAGGRSTVVCKHPKRKHMAYSCTSKCSGMVTSAPSAAGGAGIRMFFSNLAASYLHRVPSSCLPGCREPKTRGGKKSCTNVSSCCSALEAAPPVCSSLSLADASAVTQRGCGQWSLTHLQGCT